MNKKTKVLLKEKKALYKNMLKKLNVSLSEQFTALQAKLENLTEFSQTVDYKKISEKVIRSEYHAKVLL